VGIKGFEQRLENAVEGTFARLFRTSLSPVELGRKLVREMDQQRRVGVDGRPMMPNHFEFLLSAKDHDSLGDVDVSLRRELAEAAREHGPRWSCPRATVSSWASTRSRSAATRGPTSSWATPTRAAATPRSCRWPTGSPWWTWVP